MRTAAHGDRHQEGAQALPLADGRTERVEQAGLLSLLATSPRLQRQCACGAPSAGGGSCAACEATAAASFRSLQRKPLEIGAADDPLEREADAVAERVMRMEEQNWLTTGSAPSALAHAASFALSHPRIS